VAVTGAKGKAKQAKAELYRQLIVDAAQSVFAEKGYDDAKIGEIAEASGVSLQTLYSVFPGKASIYQAIQETGDRELHRRSVASSQAVAEPLASMLAGLRATTLFFLEQPDFLKLRLHGGFTWGTEPSATGSHGRTDSWRAALERLRISCERCIDKGLLVDRDSGLMARLIVSMQQVELAHWLEGGMAGEPAETADALEKQVKRAFECNLPGESNE
jgi:AcrR family transcriptional regulator